MTLRLIPCTLADAKAFTAAHHRRLPKAGAGHLWSIGVAVGTKPVGVAIIGRPVARMLDDGYTVRSPAAQRTAPPTPAQCCTQRRGAALKLGDTWPPRR